MKPILNIDDVVVEHYTQGDKFEVRDGPIAAVVGGKLLGYSLAIVPAGKRAYPFHRHHVNEEMFFVVEGEGVVRIGEQEHPIRKGDVIASPAGGPAHQIINNSKAELRYLMISTMIPSEVVEYPDSAKVAVYVGSAPGDDPKKRSFHYRGRLSEQVDYWDGEL